MFLAAVYAYKYHPNEVESAKEGAYQQYQILRTKSSQVVEKYWNTSSSTAEDEEEAIMVEHEEQQPYPEQLPPPILEGIFRDDVRREWIDAMFGKDFYNDDEGNDYTPPRQGVGAAGVASFVTYGCTIPAEEVCEEKKEDKKVGITLARMAIGLYVHYVEAGSQAQMAGVKPGSILVNINGMGLLGEPSRQALERMWHYEGHFRKHRAAAARQNSNAEKDTDDAMGPLALEFYHHGETYTALFFSSPPFGISWAPCGNFALVQRTYALAAEAGARRGCLVAAVGPKANMRNNLDHEVAASELRDLFVSGKEMSLVFCYTPAASRSGFVDRSNKEEASTPSPKKERRKLLASNDGVEVRAHPLEYRSFFSCGVGSTPRSPTAGSILQQEQQLLQGSISELAAHVVAGHIEAPTGIATKAILPPPRMVNATAKLRHHTKCPPMESLLSKWDAIDALIYCLQMHQVKYDADTIDTAVHQETRLDELRRLLASDGSMANAFLLQWVSMLCIPEEDATGVAYSKELASMLLTMSRTDDDFCQRLHFVLRSYTCTLETQRKKDDSTKNLLTLLQALERLRGAQRQLATQLSKTGKTGSRRIRPSSVETTTNAAESPLMIESQDSSPMASTSGSISPSNTGGNTFLPPAISSSTTPKKQKSVFKLFRKKNKDVSSLAAAGKTTGAAITPMKKKHASTSDLPSLSPEPVSPAAAPGTHVRKARTSSLTNLSMQLEYLSVSSLLENMTRFLSELDGICDTIERSLLKSISQKIADWALQPWSASKETELSTVTEGMRTELQAIMASASPPSPLVNPVESSEVLVSVDSNECYILPSAHFPLLLTFNVDSNKSAIPAVPAADAFFKEEQLYRTRVEVVAIRGSASPVKASNGQQFAYVVQGAVAGSIQESGRSLPLDKKSKIHSWESGGKMIFDTRSSWGAPKTLTLAVSTVAFDSDGQASQSDDSGSFHKAAEVGHCWVDTKSLWEQAAKSAATPSSGSKKVPPETITCRAQIVSLEQTEPFDQHGEIPHGMANVSEQLELELRVTTELLQFNHPDSGYQSRKRMLLYKHDDDLRQEMFAIQFITTCGNLLKASGLDLKLLTFRCIPVGAKRGFIEWIPGSVPLSDICQPFGDRSIFKRSPSDEKSDTKKPSESPEGGHDALSQVAKSGLFKYQSLQSRIKPSSFTKGQEHENTLDNNSIQSFLRSAAYDPDAPYFIRREVMDNYVKSCAGYCVLTYLLGVGDRHLDNLLLHQDGYFFHCDYSFILGNDPKKYLPMRITEDMVHGMGGRESDNYAMFLSLAGATFIALRRHENVRVILSLVRLMVPSGLPDVSSNQSPEQVINGMLARLCLYLSDEEAISYMEQLIEDSICSKMWIAVDAMHSIGKRF